MDIRKERKAFEEYLISQGVDLKYIPSIHFNGCIYDQGDDFDEDQQEALGEINLGWNAWQAAKAQVLNAQALHDRLLVKSIREHVESHIAEISVADLFDKGWLAAMKCIQNSIDMLEAQEQSND